MLRQHAQPIALAVVLGSPPAGALEPPPAPTAADPWDVVDEIIALRNASRFEEAIDLARARLTAAGSDTDLRRTIAREGKAVAEDLVERDRGDPKRTTATISALCWAIETMRTYKAEWMTTERDRNTIPSEVIRLESLAAGLAAPCVAKAQEPPPEPAPPTPGVTAPAANERPDPPPRVVVPRRSRARIGVGAGLLASSVGLAVGTTVTLMNHRENVDRLNTLAERIVVRDDPNTTPQEQADARLWRTRVGRLEQTATALGVLTAVSLVAAVVTLALPPKPVKGVRARVRPEGFGFRLEF
jgi:hypothetical protein